MASLYHNGSFPLRPFSILALPMYRNDLQFWNKPFNGVHTGLRLYPQQIGWHKSTNYADCLSMADGFGRCVIRWLCSHLPFTFDFHGSGCINVRLRHMAGQAAGWLCAAPEPMVYPPH